MNCTIIWREDISVLLVKSTQNFFPEVLRYSWTEAWRIRLISRRWFPAMKVKKLAPWKKNYGKPRQHIKTLTKVCLVKAVGFPVVMYGCKSWTLKKAEHQRIGAFELWGWRKLLRVPWTARRSNQSILKEINPEQSSWCEELTHWKRPWCWERLKAAGEGDDRGWDGWMASPTWWAWVWANSRSCCWTGKTDKLQSMGSQRVRHEWVTELNWTEALLLFRCPVMSDCDHMDCSTPGFPVLHYLPEIAGDAIQTFDPLSPPSPPALRSSPGSRSFPMGQFFVSGSQSIRP